MRTRRETMRRKMRMRMETWRMTKTRRRMR